MSSEKSLLGTVGFIFTVNCRLIWESFKVEFEIVWSTKKKKLSFVFVKFFFGLIKLNRKFWLIFSHCAIFKCLKSSSWIKGLSLMTKLDCVDNCTINELRYWAPPPWLKFSFYFSAHFELISAFNISWISYELRLVIWGACSRGGKIENSNRENSLKLYSLCFQAKEKSQNKSSANKTEQCERRSSHMISRALV